MLQSSLCNDSYINTFFYVLALAMCLYIHKHTCMRMHKQCIYIYINTHACVCISINTHACVCISNVFAYMHTHINTNIMHVYESFTHQRFCIYTYIYTSIYILSVYAFIHVKLTTHMCTCIHVLTWSACEQANTLWTTTGQFSLSLWAIHLHSPSGTVPQCTWLCSWIDLPMNGGKLIPRYVCVFLYTHVMTYTYNIRTCISMSIFKQVPMYSRGSGNLLLCMSACECACVPAWLCLIMFMCMCVLSNLCSSCVHVSYTVPVCGILHIHTSSSAKQIWSCRVITHNISTARNVVQALAHFRVKIE
jgi:hypothetical protein